MLLENLAGLHPAIAHLRSETAKVGFLPALQQELARLKLIPEIICSDTTKQVLEKDPVLVIGHHTGHYLGTLDWLASLPNRKDLLIFADTIALKFFLKNIASPDLLHIEGVSDQPTSSKISKTVRFTRRILLEDKNTDWRQKALKNKANYALAISLLENGGLVAFAPDGGRGPGAAWTPRTGEIINSLKEPTPTQIVMAKIDNRSDLPLVNLLPLGHLMRTKRDRVFLSEPLPVRELRDNLKPTGNSARDNRKTTRNLEEIYNAWQKSL